MLNMIKVVQSVVFGSSHFPLPFDLFNPDRNADPNLDGPSQAGRMITETILSARILGDKRVRTDHWLNNATVTADHYAEYIVFLDMFHVNSPRCGIVHGPLGSDKLLAMKLQTAPRMLNRRCLSLKEPGGPSK